MRTLFFAALAFGAALPFAACSSSSDATTSPNDSGASETGDQDSGVSTASGIKHVVIIVQENHTFDNHFGRYCTAAAGSNPTCNDGPSCCEAMPDKDPAGIAPTNIDDTEMGNWDPTHLQSCENAEMNGGAMDKFSNAPSCGDPQNVATADPTIIKPYWDLAGQNALADRYFQSVSGQSSSNDMYLARASFVFLDNSASPQGAVGTTCQIVAPGKQYPEQTIGDLLTAAAVPWAFFAEGYQRASDAKAAGNCMVSDPACPANSKYYPCTFDPGDVPFDYYASTVDNPDTMKDLDAFTGSITSGTGLPAVSYIKALGFKTEHPGSKSKLSDGVKFVNDLVTQIEGSSYGPSTLVILTYDEGGGYFDHVKPPADSSVDGQPYGTRIPMMAMGTFAKKNYVSHVPMEHASLVKFIEWNWLGQATGQLSTRDKTANNIGDMLDPAKTGATVPAN